MTFQGTHVIFLSVGTRCLFGSFISETAKDSFDGNKSNLNLIPKERNFKQFGRAEYYGTRYRNTLGDLYTGLVLQAWTSGRITNDNAAEFMGIKNFSHLNDIREHFGK